jgi:hypothetical protein
LIPERLYKPEKQKDNLIYYQVVSLGIPSVVEPAERFCRSKLEARSFGKALLGMWDEYP